MNSPPVPPPKLTKVTRLTQLKLTLHKQLLFTLGMTKNSYCGEMWVDGAT